MAGIGFSLKRLFNKKGFFSLCRAYGYAGIICVGPMILGVVLLAGMALVARIAGMDQHDRELMNCMLTYTLLVSLTVTSWFNMIVTRYTSDMLYEEKLSRIMPSFYGACSIMLVLGGALYGIFLFFSGVRPAYQLLCLWFALILIVVWTEMIYLTALKDYKAIVLAFAISLMVGFLLALILVILGWVSIVSLMLCVIVAYGILMAWYYKLLLDYFPKSRGSKFSFLRWFDRYRSLAFTGGFVNIGLFAHLVIMYFGPLAVQVEGLFYGAPTHDVPALFAFFSILITTVNFVTSVEVRFYPHYRNYYSLFNDKGSIQDIEQAENEMLSVLQQELTFSGHKQLISTILFVVFGGFLLELMPVGITDVSMGIYRFLCAGYGIYAISNSIMLILLYFEDYTGALLGTLAFAVISVAGTILQILFSPVKFFGLGFLAGALSFYLVVWLRLEFYTRKLPYHLLCRQAVVGRDESGIFVKLCDYLEERERRKRQKRARKGGKKAAVLSLLLLFLLSGCGQQETQEQSGQAEQQPAGDYVEKEAPEETFRDNDAIYAEDDETSVVTMYLTVTQGNAADNTNHTWTDVNAHSVYYYEENDLERYNCEGILQIGDENGPVEGEFGYGETTPNVSVQIRGQTSSEAEDKNYKIRIKDGKGEWRGQRTLALNKHVNIPLRFTNKLMYDLMKEIPQMMSARTQFVHLYVKDETQGAGADFVDYGLYVQVEQMNKTYLKNHGLDSQGQLYKVEAFEWYQYEEMKLATDPDYDLDAFEEYLEVKGSDDHSKLLEVLEKLNDYAIPIEETIEQHFDPENICYWMAFHILTGNYDVASRNAYIYSPLNSEKFYFISWDNDAAFRRTYFDMTDYMEGDSWERGLTQFTRLVVLNRMFREDQYVEMLTAAVEDLRQNYLTYEKLREMADSYAEVVKPYLYGGADSENTVVSSAEYDMLVEVLPSEVERNYQYYMESLEKPWPFFVGTPYENEEGGLSVEWDASYDMDGEEITYSAVLATDYNFQNVIAQEEGLRLPIWSFDSLEPGQYFLRVRAQNTSGYEQDCYDYYSVSGIGKVYGAKSFYVHEDGSISDYVAVEGDEDE